MNKLTLLLSLILISTSNAQVLDFGDIPRSDLEMTVYDKDSTASAVVLFEIGDAKIDFYNGLFKGSLESHIRIKILTDEGLDKADITIPFYTGQRVDAIENLKAASYVLDEDRRIQKTELGRNDYYIEERSEFWSEMKFSIPGAKKGAVIEYSYEVLSDYFASIPDWYFQSDIPVIWSEYKTRIPEIFKYISVSRGYHPYHVEEQEDYMERLTLRPSNGPSVSAGSRNTGRTNAGMVDYDIHGIDTRFVMKDIPALKDEPYMRARTDYIAHVRYELASVDWPNELPQQVIDTWQEVVAHFDEYREYGDRLKSSNTLRNAMEEATRGISDDKERMIAIYNHVANQIEWDDRHRVYLDKSLEDYYNEGIGHSSAINLVLVQMMREAGFDAYPMLISTASNGEIIGLFPESGQFNHTIAYVPVGEEYFLLDAKNRLRPYNLLPSNVLSSAGLLMYTDQLIWLPIDGTARNSRFNNVSLTMSETGFSGTASVQDQGFYALNSRSEIDTNNVASATKNILFGSGSLMQIDSAKIVEDEFGGSLKFESSFSGGFNRQGDVIYFNPMIFERLTESPFTLENRTYPVDFNYLFDESIVMNITIPEGWMVDELPQPVLFRLPERSAEFRKIMQVQENTISVSYRFKVDKLRFEPGEYEYLKSFYDQMVMSMAENIVLKKEE